jgi:hypothetical protein
MGRKARSGANLRDALAEARALGCVVKDVRRTGEKRVSHPSIAATVRINGRRKDTPRKLTCMLRRVKRGE